MYPISDLTTFCRKTLGDVPPKLVGASTTIVGSKIYLYGGRLVAERRMVTDIYMFDTETFTWEKIPQNPDSDQPRARYFHSTDAWNNNLIVFGGMALQSDSTNPEELCVLNDVRFFNLTTRRWLPPSANSPPELVPKARYAHLSSVTSNRLFVIGGQDLSNVWLDDIYVFDLRNQTWTQRREYPRHCGTYRSVAVCSNLTVRFPQEEIRNGSYTSNLGPSGTRFSRNPSTTKEFTAQDALIHLPYSAAPTDDHPSDVYLFSNYNFTNVQRELEVFSPTSGSDFIISDRSQSMTGTSFPPGLRFPTGAMLGTHFIVAGTYLTQSYQSFSIWALDLVTMTWSRIDPGSTLTSGSWFRSCLWPEANKLIIFGNASGNLAADYNRRLLSWDHVACIDLEAFGIYQYPKLYMSIEEQQLGLAALEEGVMTDFDILCDDGRKIAVSRKILEERWPWFKQQRNLFLQNAARVANTLQPVAGAGADVPLPELASLSKEPRADPRLSSRLLNLSESYPISLALVQYFYTKALITPLQHAPAVLSQLLLLSSTYNLGHLQDLVKHAMHRALTYATSVGIYGVSTLCNCRSLQIRALRVVMAYSQKRPVRRTRDREDGGSRDGTGGGGVDSAAARPRGMSDVSFMQRTPADPHANGTVLKNGGGSSSDNVNNHYRKEINETTQTTSTSAPISPLQSVSRSSLASETLMASTPADGTEDPPLLYWADDGLSSLNQSPSLTKYSVRRTSGVSSVTPASNTGYRSPSKNDLGSRNTRSPPVDTDRDDPSSPSGPVTHFPKKRFSADSIRKNANATDYSKADGLFHSEVSPKVGTEGSVEMEVDGLLEELMDYHSKRRITMTSAPLLPLPEEFSPMDEPIGSQPHTDLPFPPLLTANMSYNGDSDTPSLTPSSPRSPKGSHFSSASPSLRSRRSFTPITPPTDGWRSPPTLSPVPERETSTSDYSGHTKVPSRSGVWSPDPRKVLEDPTKDGSLGSASSRKRRAHHTNLPPLKTVIPEDAIMRRRAKPSISSEYTVTSDDGRNVGTPSDHPGSSCFPDDNASEVTEIGYMDSGFHPAHISILGTVSPHFTPPRPRADIFRRPGSSSAHSAPSPSSGTGPGFTDYPPPSGNSKRGVLQSLFAQNGASVQKKERKRAKALDPIQTQSLASRSADTVSFVTTSSNSSKNKEKKKAEKAAKTAQLAAQLKAKQLQQTANKKNRSVPHPIDTPKSSKPWEEESGGMWSVDAFR